ncbi:MAG TPA: pyridoxal phosphate-dependent aminotransferase [Thermoanaerobaculia bacterium]
MRDKTSVYMRWAKDHAAARYNLANSGMLGCSMADLEIRIEDLLLNGPNRDGYRPLLEAIAERYGVAPEQVVTAQGTSGANFLALSTLVERGDTVLIEQPTYEPILAILEFLGARVRRFPRRFEDGYRLDLDAIGDDVRLVVLTNPHNPSGVLLSTEEVAEVGRLAERVGARVLIDEVYRDVYEEEPRSLVHLGPHFVVTSSLTKSYGLSGLRCGWILAEPEVARRMRYAKDFMEAVNPLPAETMALAAFRQLPRFAARGRSILDPNIAVIRDFLAEHGEWLECVIPPRSLMVFPRLRKEEDSEPLHDWLRRRETSIVPGKYFEYPRHFRLGFAVEPENVVQGLKNLSEGLRRAG